MTNIFGSAGINRKTTSLIVSLYWLNHAINYVTEATFITVRRSSDNATETVFINPSFGFIDDDSKISNGTTSLITWRDAAGASNLYLSIYRDQNSSGHIFTQGTLARQLLVTLNGSGNIATIYFDGTDDRMQSSAISIFSPSSLFIVNKRDGNQSGVSAVLSTATSNNSDSFQVGYNLQDDLFIKGDASDGTDFTTLIEANTSENYVLTSCLFDGIDRIKTYFNGSLTNTDNIATGFKGEYLIFKIGANRNNDRFYQGEIGDIIMIEEELSDTERTNIENEIMNRYGIS